jgi:hypothetical protein
MGRPAGEGPDEAIGCLDLEDDKVPLRQNRMRPMGVDGD